MNDNPTPASVRPTKKQREMLDFIETFIARQGYSPSYREIMNGLHYNSVATVALHVGNLIKRGHLRKRDHSARSLEVVRNAASAPDEQAAAHEAAASHEDWLADRVEACIRHLAAEQVSNGGKQREAAASTAELLLTSLEVLGMSNRAETIRETVAGLQGLSEKVKKAV
jgi:hypothetical protein